MYVPETPRWYLLAIIIFLFIQTIGTYQAKSQGLKQLTILVDSSAFPGFKSGDTAFANYISRNRYINFRQKEGEFGTLMLGPSQYRIILIDSGISSSKSVFDSDSISLLLFNEQDSLVSEIKLNSSGTTFSGPYHQFLGKGIIVPSILPDDIGNEDSIVSGLMYFNKATGGLFKRDASKDAPAYWEWYDKTKPQDENDIHYGYPDDWIERLNNNEKIPVIRLRNPINANGINYATESEQKDLIIAPYEYGMLMRYSGVFEADVSQFSIHVGTAAEPLDLENNGKNGYGAILWVGDDIDRGGLRATSRMRDSVVYSELSSETFDGNTHGPIRLRVIDSTDQIQFVQGPRGSTNSMVFIHQDSLGAGLASGGDKPLVLGTWQNRNILNLNTNGNAGIGIVQPTSKLDIENQEGFNQLRLRKKFTPASSNDPKGEEGDIAWDDNYFYIKTKDGWKRTKLEGF